MADTRIDDLRRRLERDPGSRLFAQLAEELRKSGDLGEAIRVARAGLAVHSAYPSARLTLGRALLDSGDPSGARAELESALREAPDNILASRYLGQAREALGDLKGAAEQFRRTLQMAPGDKPLEAALAAVESRLAAVGLGAAAAETTAPMPRQVPPPLPPGVAVAIDAGLTPQRGTAAPGLPSAAPPPLRASPPPGVAPASRPVAPAAPVPEAQTVAPPPPAAAPASAAVFAEPPMAGDFADVLGEPATLPGTSGASVAAIEPPAADEAASGSTAPFSSSTLAELYFQQGLVDRAVEVYRQLLQQEPRNEKARARLVELEAAAPNAGRMERRKALERTIAGLELLLGAVRRR